MEGMTALAYRTRLDDAAGGQFQIKLTNTGDDVVHRGLNGAGLGRLRPAASFPRETEFRPGARIDMPTPYGAALCGADQAAEPASAELQVLRPDGTREQVRVPMPSDYDVLTRIHDEECVKLAVAAAVTVGFADLHPTGSGAEQALTGELRLTRRADTDQVVVTDLRGNTLYDAVLADGVSLPAGNGAEHRALSIPLSIRPATCATHVLAEIKQPYVFPVWIGLDGADPLRIEIPVTQQQRDVIFAMLIVVCDL
ncbi:MAG: hypothetical protein WKF47_10575 [Geodermatophilaceae bacterium]